MAIRQEGCGWNGNRYGPWKNAAKPGLIGLMEVMNPTHCQAYLNQGLPIVPSGKMTADDPAFPVKKGTVYDPETWRPSPVWSEEPHGGEFRVTPV